MTELDQVIAALEFDALDLGGIGLVFDVHREAGEYAGRVCPPSGADIEPAHRVEMWYEAWLSVWTRRLHAARAAR